MTKFNEYFSGQLVWIDFPKNNLNPYFPFGVRPAIITDYSNPKGATVRVVPISRSLTINSEKIKSICRIEENDLPYSDIHVGCYLRIDNIIQVHKKHIIEENRMEGLYKKAWVVVKRKMWEYNNKEKEFNND